MNKAIELITEERKRQIEVEGWTPEFDDFNNTRGELANVAACYAMTTNKRLLEDENDEKSPPQIWPPTWDTKWWRPVPNDRIRELVKAGALIVAAIEQIQREQKKGESN